MIKKKKTYIDNPKYINLKNNIIQYNSKVFNPNFEESKIKISQNNNSWFNFNIYRDNINNNFSTEINEDCIKPNKDINKDLKCKKITLLLNKDQKHILKIWYKCNDIMYNETIKYIKNNYRNLKEEFNNSKEFIDYNNINNTLLLYKNKIKNTLKIIKNKNCNKLKKIKKGESKKDYNFYTLKNTKNIDYINDLRKCLFDELQTIKINEELNIAKNNLNTFLKKKPYTISYGKFKLNYQNIRTYFLKDIKQEIINNCFSNTLDKDIKIKAHILDCSIKIACSNYQSAITNFENGNIKHFRIRYWKDKRSMKVLEIEECYFTGKSLCPSVFGKITGYLKNGNKKIPFDFSTIKKSCKLHYNKKTKDYSLFVPEKVNNKLLINENKKDLVGIDPGLRTFITCLSNNEAIEICNTKGSKLEKLINKKLKLKSTNNVSKKIIKKEKGINKRIKGLVDELHWKSIKFLTDNYKTILIGDMSTKGIVHNTTSVLNNTSKILAYSLSFYKYRERLEYKCAIKNCNYKKVDEYYTSKTCSVCGNMKKDLGSNKIYDCINCKTKMDRDINGCRNIIIKCL